MSVVYDISYLSIQNSAHRSIVYDYSYKVEKNRLNLENKCGLSYITVITSYHRIYAERTLSQQSERHVCPS